MAQATEVGDNSRITWDHPVIKMGIAPGYLIQELFDYSDTTWKKKHRELSPFCCKTMKGEPWFSLPALCEYLGSPHIPDEDD